MTSRLRALSKLRSRLPFRRSPMVLKIGATLKKVSKQHQINVALKEVERTRKKEGLSNALLANERKLRTLRSFLNERDLLVVALINKQVEMLKEHEKTAKPTGSPKL